ncbi:MAG: hypothetical protein Q8R82_06625 [Hyphomonadaceae bacterium]|nr:hypothetical protein [Hyphomonadaceae bacterium]
MKQPVSQKLLAVMALAITVAIAFTPTGQARAQVETVSAADSSRSLAAR